MKFAADDGLDPDAAGRRRRREREESKALPSGRSRVEEEQASAAGMASAWSVIAPEATGRSAWRTRRAVSSLVVAFAGACRP